MRKSLAAGSVLLVLLSAGFAVSSIVSAGSLAAIGSVFDTVTVQSTVTIQSTVTVSHSVTSPTSTTPIGRHVRICHIVSLKRHHIRVIVIDQRLLSAHLRLGDRLGNCIGFHFPKPVVGHHGHGRGHEKSGHGFSFGRGHGRASFGGGFFGGGVVGIVTHSVHGK